MNQRNQIGWVAILSLAVIMLLLTNLPVDASGAVYAVSSNMTSGTGGFNKGNSKNNWKSGEDGVRITVVKADNGSVASKSIDYSNVNVDIKVHFGKVSKFAYRSGTALQIQTSKYAAIKPSQPLPKIVTGKDGKNIQAIKNYFCDEQILKRICKDIGFSYDKLIGGEYKLLIEPLAYATVNGTKMAFTATEAALYNRQSGGYLRSNMPSLTHMNLPFSLYLETDDLGYRAWTDATGKKVSDEQIISSLGLGIVRFKEETGKEIPKKDTISFPDKGETSISGNPDIDSPWDKKDSDVDYVYRTDTDVITAIMVSGEQSDPSHQAEVTFHIKGREYKITGVYYPMDGEQLVWVKWHTPNSPEEITITVTASDWVDLEKNEIKVLVKDCGENPPPNPVADDRNDSFDPSKLVIPEQEEVKRTTWSVWSPKWHANMTWHENWKWHTSGHTGDCPEGCTVEHGRWIDEGCWQDDGWWDFELKVYEASLTASAEITPDENDPTRKSNTIKSGYGIRETVHVKVTTNDSSAVTPLQTVYSFFPEFYYATYFRKLERTGGILNANYEFANNPYSTYGNRTHFTPIWYKDGSYKIYTYAADCWTPAGMLSVNLTDEVKIEGDLWDDWHIAPQKPDERY